MFRFEGPLESSKSWLNRALIIQSYNPELRINSQSSAQDVSHLKDSLEKLRHGEKVFNIGEGGTTLRFFSFLVSRQPGVWTLNCHPRLLSRPQSELIYLLEQFGVHAVAHETSLVFHSSGWKVPSIVYCSGKTSSQFVSGLLLNCWNLERDLKIELKKPLVSKDYLEMTLHLLEEVGFQVDVQDFENVVYIKVPAGQIPRSVVLEAELDMSSAFSLVSAGAINGQVKITNWLEHSTQPDIYFLDLFKRMGISFSIHERTFEVAKQKDWRSVEADLINAPDLFPVLSVLCALAKGNSRLFGASQLKAKESDRIAKTCELLNLCGFEAFPNEDGAVIFGQSSAQIPEKKIVFNPDQDHRMAMAAGLLKLAGYPLEIQDPRVVEKSYAKFWKDIEVLP